MGENTGPTRIEKNQRGGGGQEAYLIVAVKGGGRTGKSKDRKKGKNPCAS